MAKYSFILIFLFQTVFASSFDLSEIESFKSNLNQSVNAPKNDCIECEHDQMQSGLAQQVELESERLEIQTNYRGGDKAHVINLVRTKDSPDRVQLTIIYAQRYCAEDFSRVDLRTGRFSYRCLVHKSKEHQEVIHIDFKDAPLLSQGQEEVYQIKLNKELDQKNINHQISFSQGPRKTNQVELKESFLGLFGQRYFVK